MSENGVDELDVLPPGRHREYLHQVLVDLARKSDGSAASDMAKDVLSGAVSVRDAMRSSAYREVFETGFGGFVEWRDAQSAETIADARTQAQHYLDQL